MSQTIIYGVSGQTLRHVPPARVSSATYAIEDLTKADDDAARVFASGSATVPPWTVTTSATAGATQANAARMSTASTTGATVGAPAAIIAADGSSEIFEISKVSANNYVEAEAELAGVYPSGSTIRGIELTASVPDGLVVTGSAAAGFDDAEDILEQQRPLRIVWTYTVGSTTIRAQERIELVRHSTASTIDVGAAILRVRDLYPDLAERLPSRASLDTLAAELAKDVEDDLRQRKVPPERVMLGHAGVRLLVLAIAAHAGELGYAPGGTATDGAWAAEAVTRYRARLEALTVGEPGLQVTEIELVGDVQTEAHSTIYRGPTLRM